MPNACAISHDSDGKSQKRSLDRAVAELAERQHGVVSRAQLLDVGLGRGAIELRLARGRLHRVHAGVYAVGHAVLTDEGRWMAAVLAGGAGAVLSHRSAAALWGIRPEGSRAAEVTVARRSCALGLGSASTAPHYLTMRSPSDDGIPVTTVPRTLFDLAAVIPRDQLEQGRQRGEIRRLWDPLSLTTSSTRHPRRPGAAAIRAVLATPGEGITRSDLEDRSSTC